MGPRQVQDHMLYIHGFKRSFIHYLMSREIQKHTHTSHWRSTYNICICIQGNHGYTFELKSSITSMSSTNQKNALRGKIVSRWGQFGHNQLKWNYVTQIHIFVHGEAQFEPLRCLRGIVDVLKLNTSYGHLYTLTSIKSSFLMSLPLLYPKTLGNICVKLKIPSCCHISLPCITGFDIKIFHQRIQTTRSHASQCHHCQYYHYCNVDFVCFHKVT